MLADRITVLRDGKQVVTDDANKFDRARIVQAMVGRDLSQHALRRAQEDDGARRPAQRVLTIQNLKMAPMVKNNSLSVFAGQITGVFGLVGAGRTETFKIVAGVMKRDFFHGGEVILRRQAGALPGARAGGEGRRRLRHGRSQGRRLLRDDVDRAQCLSRTASQNSRRTRAAVAARTIGVRRGMDQARSTCGRSAMKRR